MAWGKAQQTPTFARGERNVFLGFETLYSENCVRGSYGIRTESRMDFPSDLQFSTHWLWVGHVVEAMRFTRTGKPFLTPRNPRIDPAPTPRVLHPSLSLIRSWRQGFISLAHEFLMSPKLLVKYLGTWWKKRDAPQLGRILRFLLFLTNYFPVSY